MLSLGRDEALNFVTEKLGVGEVERKFVEDKLSLLNEMISAFHHNVPFQTLTLMAVSPDIRQIPSADEIKADLFSGKGGLCTALNGFFNAVLVALGYNAYITGGRMWSGDLCTHVIIIVQSVCQLNDVFLVDVGLGYPTLNAIPLNFETESPVVVELIWWGKFVRLPTEPGETQCHATFSRQRKPQYPAELRNFGFAHRELPDEWTTIYKFSLEPRSFEELCEAVHINVYKNISHVLSRTLRVIQWRNGRATTVINNHVFQEEGEGHGHSTLLESDEDIVSTIHREFPIFDEDTLTAAVKQWRCLWCNKVDTP